MRVSNDPSIIQWLARLNRPNWDYGLYGACSGGHLELVQMAITNGATDLDGGLLYASLEGRYQVVKWLIEIKRKELPQDRSMFTQRSPLIRQLRDMGYDHIVTLLIGNQCASYVDHAYICMIM